VPMPVVTLAVALPMPSIAAAPGKVGGSTMADSKKVPDVYSVGVVANSALAAKGTDSVTRRPAKAVPRTSWRY